MDPPLHQDVQPLAFLIGTWRGMGRGEYPTIEPFVYEETLSFTHNGKPFLIYNQRTKAGDDGRPLHAETGYWRLPVPDRVEVVLAHPTGVVEVQEGSFDGNRLSLRSVQLARSGSAKEVTEVRRDFIFDDDVIRYSLSMAAVGVPLTFHLEAELLRS